MKSTIKSIIIRVVAVYILLCGSFWFFQHLFFLHPKALPADYHFSFAGNFEEKQINLNEKTLIDIVQFKTDDTVPKGVVLYFHGNRKNIEHYAAYAQNFTKRGYECWMVDYPGYGKSTGNLNAETMQETATQLYKMASAKYGRDKIIIYGKSLGTGLAAWLGSVRDCGQVILETPYYSMVSLAQGYIPFMPVALLIKMNFTTAEYLKSITAPLTVFHGLQDEVIPFANAMRLIPYMKKGDRFVPIPGGMHNDLPSKNIYQATLDSLL